MKGEAANEIAAKKLPVLVNLQWPEKPKDADPNAEPSLRTLRFRDRAPSTPAAFAKAGVKFAFYSGGISAPKEILKAVKKSIDAGLSADDALRALTLAPAQIFGVADRLGSLETGKIANLVVTDGDLFAEKTKVKLVFVDGRKFEVREPARPSEPPKGDLSGKWKLSYTTPDGPEEATADLTMASDGPYLVTPDELPDPMDLSIRCSLSGEEVQSTRTSNMLFSVPQIIADLSAILPLLPGDVIFTGTFEKDSMKGTLAVPGFSIDFTGTKPGAQLTTRAEE